MFFVCVNSRVLRVYEQFVCVRVLTSLPSCVKLNIVAKNHEWRLCAGVTTSFTFSRTKIEKSEKKISVRGVLNND